MDPSGVRRVPIRARRSLARPALDDRQVDLLEDGGPRIVLAVRGRLPRPEHPHRAPRCRDARIAVDPDEGLVEHPRGELEHREVVDELVVAQIGPLGVPVRGDHVDVLDPDVDVAAAAAPKRIFLVAIVLPEPAGLLVDGRVRVPPHRDPDEIVAVAAAAAPDLGLAVPRRQHQIRGDERPAAVVLEGREVRVPAEGGRFAPDEQTSLPSASTTTTILL
jgi:hypothetical protein